MNRDDAPPVQPPAPASPQTPSQNQPQPAEAQPQFLGYDMNGQPLYGTPKPQQPQQSTQTSVNTTPLASDTAQQQTHYVHFSRAIAPEEQPISPEIKAKHDESTRRYPWLNLSDGEYVISAVRRHPIGLFMPVIVGVFLLAVILSVLFNYPAITTSFAASAALPGYGAVLLFGGLLALLVMVGTYIAVWIYVNNKFFLTNESVIQEIQHGLFARNEQTVSLANIEDASFTQRGILQTLMDYGAIRLSTEGDETTYRFYYVAKPKHQIAILNNAVEAFKNGRPVDPNDN